MSDAPLIPDRSNDQRQVLTEHHVISSHSPNILDTTLVFVQSKKRKRNVA